MKLTKLRAAPVRRAEVPPCARAARMDAGTASQLIPGVRQTLGERATELGTVRRRRLLLGGVAFAVALGAVAAWAVYLLFHQNWAVVRGLRLGQTHTATTECIGTQSTS